MTKNKIIIYTDGGCRGNATGADNIGAWAYCMTFGNAVKEDSQAVRNTTNNRMELSAVINALKVLKLCAKRYSITVFSDSQYVVNGINQWCVEWIKKDFRKVANDDLWRELIPLVKRFPNIEFLWVKGHNGEYGNERVDYLCNLAMDKETNK